MYIERSGIEPRPLLPASLEDRLRGWLLKVIGAGFLALALVGWLCLMTWSASDPSLTHATSGGTRNLFGPVGAIFSDLLLQSAGFAAVFVFLAPAYCGLELILTERLPRTKRRIALFAAAIIVLSGGLSALPVPANWPLNHGIGGAGGDLIFDVLASTLGWLLPGPAGAIVGLGLFAGGMSLLSAALGLDQRDWSVLVQSNGRSLLRPRAPQDGEEADAQHGDVEGSGQAADYGTPSSAMPAFLASGPAVRETPAPPGGAASPARPRYAPHPPHSMPVQPGPAAVPGGGPIDEFDHATNAASRSMAARFSPNRAVPAEPAALSRRSPSEILGSLMAFRSNAPEYRRPSMNILKRPAAPRPGAEHIQPVLRGSARLLEDVLNDFGIKAEVKGIKPGPVVTLFEVEPARGIKASRVIALADDIARSMSAVSARVSTVVGRNVIGIELPNVRRDQVQLRELLEHDAWRNTEATLPVALGKSIGGDPVIADLARMPHLLIAGTTGSGKSVGVNALIVSLLYRLSPGQCRFLMIDPKMLELSVYNGIPHLLSPVVTDPHRAAAALAWVVSEMEERYKQMAQLGVRNIEMFNVRVRNARKRGEIMGRTVQTGFDERTGEAVYVREDVAPEPMPYIVVVVDEFADLMAVAGKEVEGSVQRLAQMARAAGIHLVMATQRPSVDVVTGTIKANFPSRLAFKVASRIDSRTIINETGAEQLLGAGDMLYSPGAGQLTRVHGPFVSDEEVERVASSLREQGEPDYVDALARLLDPSVEPGGASPAADTAVSAADDLFDRAVAIVHRDGKASISYVQRRLGIGYNRAADLMERMEQEGIVSPADSSGRRRVLIGQAAVLPGEAAE